MAFAMPSMQQNTCVPGPHVESWPFCGMASCPPGARGGSGSRSVEWDTAGQRGRPGLQAQRLNAAAEPGAGGCSGAQRGAGEREGQVGPRSLASALGKGQNSTGLGEGVPGPGSRGLLLERQARERHCPWVSRAAPGVWSPQCCWASGSPLSCACPPQPSLATRQRPGPQEPPRHTGPGPRTGCTPQQLPHATQRSPGTTRGTVLQAEGHIPAGAEASSPA